MAFNLSLLSDYTKANETQLVVKTLFTPKTASMLGTIRGVKSSIQVNNLAQSVFFQSADNCNTTPSGTTSITNRILTVGRIAVLDKWCLKDLDTKYTQLLEAQGAHQEGFPVAMEQALVDSYKAEISNAIETALWQGDTNSSTVNLNRFDGLVKIIGAASAVIDSNTAAFQGAIVSSVTVSNILSIVDGISLAIPQTLLEQVNLGEVKLVMGLNNFRIYQLGLKNANYNNVAFNPTGDSLGYIMHPGTMLRVEGVPGLTGTNNMYVANWKTNVFKGVDLESDSEVFDMWFSKDQNALLSRVEFNLGVQIALPNEVVKFVKA